MTKLFLVPLLLLSGFFGDWPAPPQLPPGSKAGWKASCARAEHRDVPATILACQESPDKAMSAAHEHQRTGHISAYWESCIYTP